MNPDDRNMLPLINMIQILVGSLQFKTYYVYFNAVVNVRTVKIINCFKLIKMNLIENTWKLENFNLSWIFRKITRINENYVMSFNFTQ